MDISTSEFSKEVLESKTPVLVEFWASWCLPCQTANSLLEEIKKEYKKKIKVIKINLDKNPTFSSKYNVKGLPTFMIFKKGKEKERKIGAQSKDNLCQMIEKFI
ncbi:MAG TPA: thioredoxin [Patescibacteria group bacterium]|nr:thioredoxin [Patescibacteria group bacterium]